MAGRIKIILGLLVVCFGVSVCCCAKDANAMTCNNITYEYNQALKVACENDDTARGALWISSYAGAGDLEALVDHVNNNTKVYLHGVTLSNSGGYSSYATCIIIHKDDLIAGDSPLEGMSCEEGKKNYSPVSFIDLNTDALKPAGLATIYHPAMFRQAASRGGVIYSNVKEIGFDLDEAIKKSSGYKDVNGKRVYEINVNVFRCYDTNVNGAGCYSDKSVLKISTSIPNSFQGISTVRKGDSDWGNTSNDQKVSTGLAPEGDDNSNRSATLEVDGCDDGCKITMSHALVRNDGNAPTYYRLRKWSNVGSVGWNWVDDSGGVMWPQSDDLRKKTFTQNGTQQPVLNDSFDMYVGQKTCEEMAFSPKGTNSKQGLLGTKVCALAIGFVETTLKIKVKNNSLDQTNYGEGGVARPRDEVEFSATYDPKAQGLADRVPEKLQINGVWKTNVGEKALKDAYNDNNGDEADWNNAFRVHSEGFLPVEFAQTYNYPAGDSSVKEVTNNRSVSMDDVGRELREIVNINEDAQGSTTPKQVRFFNDGGSLAADVVTGEYDVDNNANLVASVIVPYNFKNVPSIGNISDIKAYAGENVNIPYTITTKPKSNSLVGGDPYATIVRKAKWKVGICTDIYDVGACDWYESSEGEDLHNDIDKIFEETKKTGSLSATIGDWPAGTEIYIRSAVYPAESSNDDAGWADPEGNHEWAYSEPAVVRVVKKPSFQVWGGDVLVENGVNIPLANKAVLDGGYNSDVLPRKFGSWGELSVETGSDNTSNLFSGAALGFAGNNDGELSPNYSFLGDNDKTASYSGPGNNGSGINPGSSNSSGGDLGNPGGNMVNIEALVDRLDGKVEKIEKENVNTVGGFMMKQDGSVAYNSIMYKNKNGTITIDGDIEYSGNYSTLDSIPKVIIYANSIKINCDVERIDAILIAENNVETCPFAEGDDKKNNLGSPARSVQLRINGAVIAGGSVSFDRSYGAGTGANSMIPAEIINMDPSWYLWAADSIGVSGASMEHDDTEGLMIPTYTCELPPRY